MSSANDAASHPPSGPPAGAADAESRGRIAVLLPLPLPGAYDYAVPEDLVIEPGDHVVVPLGGRTVLGVAWGAAEGSVEAARLKPVEARLPVPPMGDVARRFVDWIAAYYCQPPGAVLRMALGPADAWAPARPRQAVVAGDRQLGEPGIRVTGARSRLLAALADLPALPPAELAMAAGVGSGVVKGLVEAGVLRLADLPPRPPFAAPDIERPGAALSPPQERAASALRDAVAAGAFSVHLLDGVTGSGKTEVYFEAIAACLAKGRQALVLLPEIALSDAWLARFADRFGCAPAVWHSEVNALRRRVTWRAVAEGAARVMVGARSALFLPFDDLGLIVVDEEHEAAFKQEDGVPYHARDMAVARGRLAGHPVVLASATPALETLYNVQRGRYGVLALPDRHGDAALPAVDAVDMRADPPPPGGWLAPTLRRTLADTVAAGGQALLFLNRRGYAPLTLCRACGHRYQCPNCTAWLVEHRRLGRLQCHHCGHAIPVPRQCAACGADDALVACGPGIERVCEEVAALLPQARILAVSSDSLRGPAAAEALRRAMLAHEIDVLVGTQVLAKGHHFPGLTLVGVVDADLGLDGGDLRAAERTYQLIVQVAGRAGREDRPGRVLVQSYRPDHPVIAAVCAGDRDGFVAAELAAREAHAMPPFGRLVAVIVSGRDATVVEDTARALGRAAPRLDGDGERFVHVFGPAPAPLAMVRGRHRRRLLLHAGRAVRAQPLLRQWLAGVKVPAAVRVAVDVDPYSFL
ncbi:MAG: primosomal protein N' [Alphaproteobacteria bacterium]